jgi:hypothetical protein
VTEQEQVELWRLRTKWLGVYHVALVDDIWRAKRYRDVTRVLTADTAAELDGQIQADHAGSAG